MTGVPMYESLPNIKTKKSFLTRVGEKIVEKKYLYPAFLLPIGIMLAVFIALEVFPFGDRSILILDMNAQYVYFFEQLRDVLTFDASLLYTFERSLGGEFFGIFTYYLSSPLSLIILLFPADMITEAILVIMLLKCGFAGFSFAYFLDKTRKKNAVGFTIFSTMYALCSYAVTFQSNTMWMDALIWLPLIALGVERIIKTGSFKLYVVALALTIWSNYYIGYMTCIFVVLYFICYYFAHSKDEINPYNENLHFIKSVLRMALYSIVAILISALIVVMAYYSLGFGKSTFQEDVDFSTTLRFDFIDLLTKMFIGSYDTVRFQGHPNIYSGTLMLIMIPAYFLCKKIPSKEKIVYACLCAVFVASFSMNNLDLIWHGFQIPIWLNYRYSFMFSFVMLVMAYRGFEHYKELGSTFFLKVGVALVALLMVIQKTALFFRFEEGSVKAVMPDYQIIWTSIAFIAAYLLIIHFSNKKKLPLATATFFVCCVIIELFTSSLTIWEEQIYDVGWLTRDDYRSFVSRMEVAMEKVEDIEDENAFYRTETTVLRKPNDAFVLNMNGVSEFSSTFNEGSIRFLKKVGFISRAQSSKYISGNEVIDSILGIKYMIGSGPNADGVLKDQLSAYYETLYTIEEENLIIYRNPYALSIAYAVDKKIKENTLAEDIYSPFEYTEVLLGNMLGTDSYSVFDPCTVQLVNKQNCNDYSNNGALQIVRKNEGTSCSFTYYVTATHDGSIYMYLPSPYSTSATFYVENERVATLFSSDTQRIYNLGNYKKGDTVRVRFDFNHFRLYLYNDYPFFVQVNEENLANVTNLLKSEQLNVKDFSDTKIVGELTATSDKTVFTTIPYDKGWKVYVDGKQVETFKTAECMLSFDVSEGEHDIEMKYMPNEFIFGLTLTILGIFLFAALIVIDYFRRKNRVLPVSPEKKQDAEMINSSNNEEGLKETRIHLGQEQIYSGNNKKVIYLQPVQNENEATESKE